MIRDNAARALGAVLVGPLKRLVDEALDGRRFVDPAEVEALQGRLAAAEKRDAEKVTALEAEVKALTKKLSMATGALQAASMQLADAKKAAEEAKSLAARATIQAASALATAESARS